MRLNPHLAFPRQNHLLKILKKNHWHTCQTLRSVHFLQCSCAVCDVGPHSFKIRIHVCLFGTIYDIEESLFFFYCLIHYTKLNIMFKVYVEIHTSATIIPAKHNVTLFFFLDTLYSLL